MKIRDALITTFVGAWVIWVSGTLWQVNERLARIEATVCPPSPGDRLAGAPR